MLKPEVARERLKSFVDENWKAERSAALAKLPEQSRNAAQILLEDYPYWGTAEWQARREAERAASQRLDELHASDRVRVFEALFPALGIHVERAWALLVTAPYQLGFQRKTFRAPNLPAASRWSRFVWLERLWNIAGAYSQELTWFAGWAPYLGWDAPDTLGILFAAAIDAGGSEGDAVFDVLCASARGEHEIGAMGRHVTRGLLLASRQDGWEFVERLLLAAQLQEGLRQVILETIDEAHPQAFRRMLRLILDHNLVRFSATVRAIGVWFGFAWDSAEARGAAEVLANVARLLDDAAARAEALASGDGRQAYLALWAMAHENAFAAAEPAAELLGDDDVERRFAGIHLLAQLRLEGANSALLVALDDRDLRVATRAVVAVQSQANLDEAQLKSDLFERLERALPRFPRRKTALEPIVWPWLLLPAAQEMVIHAMIRSLGDRSPRRLVPYIALMSPVQRGQLVHLLAGVETADADIRATLFSLVGDPSSLVREDVLLILARQTVSAEEAVDLERLLTRKADDLRRGVISVLLNQADRNAFASAERLLAASNPSQRAAGLELLREMKAAKRMPGECRCRAERCRLEQNRATAEERRLLDIVLQSDRPAATLEDALGLLDPERRTTPAPPNPRRRLVFTKMEPRLVTNAAIACLKSLDELVQRHRETPIPRRTWEGETVEALLGNADGWFPSPALDVPAEEDVARLPLREVWETWRTDRLSRQRDGDGFELLRALAPFFDARYYIRPQRPGWLEAALRSLLVGVEAQALQYRGIVMNVLKWLLRLHSPPGAADFLLDAIELSLTLVPKEAFAAGDEEPAGVDWARDSKLLAWLEFARYHRSACPATWEDAHHAQLWRLLRWLDEPVPGAQRHRPMLEEVLAAFEVGAATEADLLDQLLGPRFGTKYSPPWFSELHTLTSRKPSPLFEQYPILREVVDRSRERIVEVELARGDLPTAASPPAVCLRSAGGVRTLVRLLRAMGRESFARGWTTGSLSRMDVFTHLVQVTFPAETDTPEAFRTEVEAARIPRKRLIELAVYAPQWAGHVEHTLGWPGLTEAVWWLHAHTKDRQWHVEEEVRNVWAAQIAERTPVSTQSLLDGAVDVAWFWRVYQALGPERWDEVDDAAKYASGGVGHERARAFADAMLGRVEKSALVGRIAEKRHQDSVRALGLMPLAEGDGRERDLLERYEVIQDLVRTSRKFGAQRQESEKLAAAIGLENLARTAGYPDPLRLQWAMEARAIADLAEGPVTVTVGNVALSLAIDDLGEPDLTVSKGGRPLKSIPAQVKKDPAVVELQERQRAIRRQASRVRSSLEQAMCRGDSFSGAELRGLFKHPVLTPLLRGLVFVGAGSIGYPIERGLALEAHDGTVSPVGDDEPLRIAHPYDLLATNEWHLWQRECFARERIQPFKQVFRELYVLTRTEREEGTLSRRYAGHQVQPKQALALLGQRGWVNHPEEGLRRTFHDVGLSVWLTFLGGTFTPAEVEGVTIEGVGFSRSGEWKPLPLTEVPPRVFSEVMRDVDLVVSVAHRGGVDPEASASTVEMRTSLIRETCAMLRVGNVRLQGNHALIEGGLGSYSVHLGSAVVHRQPGGALCIVPVHAQHRGRIFLPFADDDPRTAEVLSKILLLARDKEIKDPTILEQILS